MRAAWDRGLFVCLRLSPLPRPPLCSTCRALPCPAVKLGTNCQPPVRCSQPPARCRKPASKPAETAIQEAAPASPALETSGRMHDCRLTHTAHPSPPQCQDEMQAPCVPQGAAAVAALALWRGAARGAGSSRRRLQIPHRHRQPCRPLQATARSWTRWSTRCLKIAEKLLRPT